MAQDRKALHSGGCQCGALRYALYGEPFGSHICHCRMCQKAFGGFYAPLTLINHSDFAWTRGRPAVFRSSADVTRGFCPDCGTPLTFVHEGSKHLNVAIGSLDHPETCKPEIQIGIESRMPWHADLPKLKEAPTQEVVAAERLARIESRQHPDHDTETWPPG